MEKIAGIADIARHRRHRKRLDILTSNS